jgi:hypothetical protein
LIDDLDLDVSWASRRLLTAIPLSHQAMPQTSERAAASGDPERTYDRIIEISFEN